MFYFLCFIKNALQKYKISAEKLHFSITKVSWCPFLVYLMYIKYLKFIWVVLEKISTFAMSLYLQKNPQGY